MELPHFDRATRRAFLRQGLAATGALSAASVVLAACSKSDAETFADGQATATTAPAAPTTTTATNSSPTDAAATTTTTTTGAAAASPSTSSAPSTSTGASTAAPVGITFTYTASDSSGRVRNPYVAVWVEDTNGELVGLIGAWYSTRDAKYLRDLTDFTAASTAVSAAALGAVTGATRSAGQYQLQWNGRGLDGAALTGPHTLWVEAAREHGPHSVTSGSITLATAGVTTITGNGELSDVVVTIA